MSFRRRRRVANAAMAATLDAIGGGADASGLYKAGSFSWNSQQAFALSYDDRLMLMAGEARAGAVQPPIRVLHHPSDPGLDAKTLPWRCPACRAWCRGGNEGCESCQQVAKTVPVRKPCRDPVEIARREREKEEHAAIVAAVPQKERRGTAPKVGEVGACFCNDCKGEVELRTMVWRRHYRDKDRWLEDGYRKPAPLPPPHAAKTVQRFFETPQRIFEKNEFFNAHLPWLVEVRPTLRSVQLDYQALGDDGACALAAALQRGSKVTSVRAAHCGIGSAGAVALGAALAGAVNLCLLDVSWNRVGRSGALAIATGLRTHPSVLEVRMECNGIGAGGVEALAAPLTSNTVLERIYVVGNNASRAEKLLVEAALLKGREGVRGAAAGAVECYV